MSKSLKRRVGALETMSLSGRLFYCVKTDVWAGVSYWILPKAEMEPKHYPGSMGPFRSAKAARAWSLEDLQHAYPKAYERLLKQRLLEDIYVERFLTVDTMPEYVAELVHKGELTEEAATALFARPDSA
jgi:hypothetical protein